MALGSRLKALDTALEALIQTKLTALGETSVKVDRGHPGEELAREHVWTADIHFDENPQALAPTNPRRQQITATVVVRIRQEGRTNAALRDRCCDVADYVEEALRADITAQAAVDFGGVSQGDLDSFKDTDGRVASIVLQATYNARKG